MSVLACALWPGLAAPASQAGPPLPIPERLDGLCKDIAANEAIALELELDLLEHQQGIVAAIEHLFARRQLNAATWPSYDKFVASLGETERELIDFLLTATLSPGHNETAYTLTQQNIDALRPRLHQVMFLFRLRNLCNPGGDSRNPLLREVSAEQSLILTIGYLKPAIDTPARLTYFRFRTAFSLSGIVTDSRTMASDRRPASADFPRQLL